jgi:hypothetical protein
VLPDRDKDLGEVRPDQFIVTSAKQGPQDTALDVSVVDGDDPAAQAPRTRLNHHLSSAEAWRTANRELFAKR